jgi:hypothetical protein
LVVKIFLAEKAPDDGCKVSLTFGQALEVIRKLDNLTCGIPKIAYLVGWQFNGHDSKYPSWAEVNPRLKRAQDATARDSLCWLMDEASKYHTTVSLHINMFDAFEDSPLWKEYLEKDVVAYSGDSALLFRRKAPGLSEGKRPMIPKDCAPPFQLIAPGCSGRIGA